MRTLKKIAFIASWLFAYSNILSQSPNAEFSATPLVVCVGDTVYFTDLSSPGNSPIIQWDWNFGDGGSSTIKNAKHVYSAAGDYTITLVVTNSNNLANPEVKTNYIKVNPNPIASFSATASSCTLPVSVTFNNSSSSGTNFSYLWDFDNGTTSTQFSPGTSNYSTPASYDVSLLVTNTTTGCHSTKVSPVVISNFVANFNSVDSICVGGTTTLTDLSTIGANTWNWNSGSGQSSSIQNPTFTYNTAGTFTITLTSQNTLIGCTSTITKQIVVVPLPIPTFTVDEQRGCAPFHVNFTNTSPSTLNNFVWNFGNGSTYSGLNPPEQIYNPGNVYDTFDISITCSGILGCTNTINLNNYIYTAPLLAKFNAIDSMGCSPLTADYNNLSTFPYSAFDPIISYVWTFDDGTTYNGPNPPNDIYPVGLYDLSLTVTTQNGCVNTLTKPNYIQVGSIDTVDFTSSPSSLCVHQNFNFTDQSVIGVPYNPGELTYNWLFGDGGESHIPSPSYAYTIDTGYYNVTFQIVFRGCMKMITKDSVAHIKPSVARFQITPGLICNPVSFPVNISLSDMSTIGDPSHDVEMIWRWDNPTNGSLLLNDVDLDPDDDGSITHDFTGYGTYTVKQVIYNHTTGCNDSITHELVISEIIPDFILSSDSICVGDEVTFTENSSSTNGLISNFFQFYANNNVQFQPPNSTTEEFDSSATYIINYFTMNDVGCTGFISKTLTVLEKPLAVISPSDDASCAPVEIIFYNNSTPQGNGYSNLTQFEWTLPDGSIQVLNSFDSVKYTFLTQGNFPTSLIATDGFGCVSDEVTINTSITKPTPNFNIDSVVCNHELFSASNSTTGINPISYVWSIDHNPSSNAVNLDSVFNEQIDTNITHITHLITLYATDSNGCLDSISKNIHVSLPFANLDYVATGANLNTNNSATCPPVFEDYDNQSTSFGTMSYSWNFGDGNSSTLFEPQNTYVFAGTYSLFMQVTDQYGCIDDTTFIDYLTIGGPSVTTSIIPTSELCDNAFVFDTLSTNNVVNYEWDFGDGTSIENQSNVEHNYPNAGTYYTSLIIYDSVGCKVIYPLDTIILNNQITAHVVPSSLEVETNSEVIFDDQSIFNVPGVSWTWNFGDFNGVNLINSNDVSTSYSYQYPYTYTVILTVQDVNGCIDSDTILIHVKGSVHVPNVFTVNGDDINDILTFPFDIFKSYDVLILNRWGVTVYDRTNETGTYIWDGTHQGKEECPDGVYYYIIKGFLLDESPFEVTGFVTKFGGD